MKNKNGFRKTIAWLGVVVVIAVVLAGGVMPAGAATSVNLWIELNEWMSCPFVFTWNGQDYEIENDLFSVGRGPANEFTDYLGINNSVQPRDGVYSFVIREVPSEKSYIDMLKLMAIDHPAGVGVGVDSSGNAHSYANPMAPSSAVDSSGNDVLSSVALKDDSGANLFHGDDMTLDFGSVDISEGAKLVLRVDGFEGDPTGDVFPGVPSVRIQTLESGAWVTRHTFFPKELWAEGVFDLRPYLTESQQVRLVSDSCLSDKYHVIDWVALDNTADQVSVSVLDPVSASLNDQSDVLSLIAGSDNRYAFTQSEDFITVAFPVSPLNGDERSFAFVSEGYYETDGNTYYVDTWNGSSWVQRGSWMLYSQGDQMRSLNVGPYLPDPQGEYKIRLRNRMSWSPQWAYVDFVYLVADGVTYYPYQATEEGTGADILPLLTQSDDVKWYSMNRSSVIKFDLNGPPNANAGPDQTVDATSPAGAAVPLDGSGSSDPNNDPLNYSWSWSGGSASGVSPVVNLPVGTTVVTLTVSDAKYSATDTVQVTVNAPPFTASAGGPYSVSEGSSINLNGSGADPFGSPLTLAWDLDNDGQYDDATGATPAFSAAGMDGPGVRNIGLEVTRNAGLYWDFENTTSVGGISTSAGAAGGASISGLASQTGGGPAENFGGSYGIVSLTRFLGPVNYPYIQFTTTETLNLESISFTHVHNHNWGFPTQNGYQAQLQIDSGSGYSNIGSPLAVNSGNNGTRSTIALGSTPLAPGTHRIRWLASGFAYGDNSNTEFFAMNDLDLKLSGTVRATSATTVTVSNVAPAVNAGPDVTINQGQMLSNAGSFVDPGADVWNATVNYGDGPGATALALGGKAFQLDHAYANAGVYTATVTVSDDDGGVGTDTVMVTVRDVIAPTSAGQVPAPNAAGWYKTDVAVGLSATDNPGGSGVKEIHYTINSGTDNVIAGNAGSVSISVDGVYTVAYYAVDNAGNIESAKSVTIQLDKTAPVITGSRTPDANADGWNNTDVTVSFSGSDNLSGIELISGPTVLSGEGAGLSVSGVATDRAGNSASATVGGINIDKTLPTLDFGAVTPAPNAAGWNNTDVQIGYAAADALSGVASVSAPSPLSFTSEGDNLTQTVTVTDRAGNSRTFTSPAVRIDKTAPVITGTRTPGPNPHGWNNADVTVSFSATDSLSGISSVTPDITLSAEGANQSATGTAVDQAGNSSSCTVGGISIDKTPPIIAGSRTPEANSYGWNNTDVTVTFSYSDSLSGVDAAPEDVMLSGEGAGQSVTGKVSDKAGNISSTTVSGISIDKTKPTLSFGALAPAPNAAGWNNTDVQIAYDAGDALSGVAFTSTSSPLSFSTEGNNLTQAVTVTDKAGNSETLASPVVRIDKTAPVIAGSRAPDANANGWNNTDVIVSFSATDSLSGISSVTPDITLSAEGPSQSVTGEAVDVAGNRASATVGGINIDKTLPVVTIASPEARSYLTSESLTLDFGAADAISGVLTLVATLDGTAVANGQAIDLSGMAGEHVLTVASADRAGNSQTRSVAFVVVIDAGMDIAPDTLNLKSKSDKNAITVYTEFPAEYDVSKIDISTVTLLVNGKTIKAQLTPTALSDYDGDGALDLMVKFDRQALIAALGTTTGEVRITVSGQLVDGRRFSGVDTIKVINPVK